jgi:hypothetical protein
MAPSNAPIFVIGSPRSGTSILTWCLGQHPNILPLEETGWFSRLALTLQSCHEEGSARGERSQLSAMQISRDELFQTVGDAINAMILRQRSVYQAACAEIAEASGTAPHPAFLLARNGNDPKGRWVDGTPEYSFSAFALRALFPEARFIHILRDARAVVRSLMRFSDLAGYQLVKTEEDAYRYWLRTTRACVAAGRAFGSDVVHRLRYRDLVEAPDASLQTCLKFLDETYSADRLMPLKEKINSSKVHDGFDPTDERTDPALRQEAHELFDALNAEDPALVGGGTLDGAGNAICRARPFHRLGRVRNDATAGSGAAAGAGINPPRFPILQGSRRTAAALAFSLYSARRIALASMCCEAVGSVFFRSCGTGDVGAPSARGARDEGAYCWRRVWRTGGGGISHPAR